VRMRFVIEAIRSAEQMKKYLLSLAISLFFTSAAVAGTPQELLDAGSVEAAQAQLAADAQSDDASVSVQALSGLVQLELARQNIDAAKEYAKKLSENLSNSEYVSKLEHGKKSGWLAISPWLDAQIAKAEGRQEDVLKSLKKAEQMLERAEVSEDWAGAINMELSFAVGDDEKRARKYVEEAIEHYKSSGNALAQGQAEVLLGDLELGRGKERRAISYYEDAVKSFRKASDLRAVAETRVHAAEKLKAAGEDKAAQAHLAALKDDFEAAGSPGDLTDRIKALGVEI